MTDVDATAIFLILDADDSGTLSPGEVRAGVAQAFGVAAPTPIQIDLLFEAADADHSGFIDPEEFSKLVKGLCSKMSITVGAFNSAVVRSEYLRMFDRMSIQDRVPRQDCEALLGLLCEALESPLNPETLLRALDLSRGKKPSSGTGTGMGAQGLGKSDFVTLLTELTQNRPSPIVTRVFNQWEQGKRESIKKAKFGSTSGSSSKGSTSKAPTSSCVMCADLFEELEKTKQKLQAAEEDVEAIRQEAMREAEENLKLAERSLHESQSRETEAEIRLEQREEKIARLERQLASSHRRTEEVEALNRNLLTAQTKEKSESARMSEKARHLEDERLRLSVELESMQVDYSRKQSIADFFLSMEDNMKAIIAAFGGELLAVRERALSLQVAAVKTEQARLAAEKESLATRRKRLDESEAKVLQQQLDIGQREGKLKDQMKEFASLQLRAEKTTLPEREHRMQRLGQLERDVCRREAAVGEREDRVGHMEELRRHCDRMVARLIATEKELEETKAQLKLQTSQPQPVGVSIHAAPLASQSPSPSRSTSIRNGSSVMARYLDPSLRAALSPPPTYIQRAE